MLVFTTSSRRCIPLLSDHCESGSPYCYAKRQGLAMRKAPGNGSGFGGLEDTNVTECLRLLGGKDYLLAGGASASSAQEGVQRAIAKVGCSARHANTLNNSPFDSCLFTISHQCLRVRMSC